MKLKKILSLALSGILAVSMLAGCGGGISSVLSNRNSAFREALNSAQGDLTYRVGDSDLNDAISTVAGTLVDGQVANGIAPDAVSRTVEQLTGYKEMPITKWNPLTTAQENHFVAVFTYDIDDSKFDTWPEVAADVKTYLDKIELAGAKDDQNSYTGYVAAYETTVGEGDDAYDACVIGVVINQTVKAK